MIEGEKTFDITLRWPERLRGRRAGDPRHPGRRDQQHGRPGACRLPATPPTGPSSGAVTTGTSVAMPTLTGSIFNAHHATTSTAPRRRLARPGDAGRRRRPARPERAVHPPGRLDDLPRAGQAVDRRQVQRARPRPGRRRGRGPGKKVDPLFKAPYRAEWSGEFRQMEEAEQRLMLIVPVSLVLIFLLLYLAFRSLLDAAGHLRQRAGDVARRRLGAAARRAPTSTSRPPSASSRSSAWR